MKQIQHVNGPSRPGYSLSLLEGLTYQPRAPLPQCTDGLLTHYQEFDRVARKAQPEAMCYIGSSLITTDWKDIDMLVLLPEDTDLADVGVPDGYLQTSPTREGTLESDMDYPDVLRCFRKGIYNLILTTDREMFDNFRRASLLMQSLADADDLLRMAFHSKESRISLYQNIGSVDE